MKKTLLIFILIISSYTIRAQDAHLSMYDAAPLFLNPALTGVVDADFRLHAQYRTQWKAVNFKPYTSYLFSFDMPIKKWSFGVQLSNFRAGYGNFNVFQGLLSTSYNTAINKKKTHMMSFGVQAGLSQKSVEFQLLSFNNQYSLTNGGQFDESIASGESFKRQTVYIPAVNAGIMYYYAKPTARLNPFIGISAFNLLHSKESFYGVENRLPLRYYAHLGTRINITETFYLIPKILVMMQEKFFEQTYALEAGYYFKNSDFYLLGGVIFRAKDALAITLGAKWDRFILKLGYDVNVSTLSKVSTGRGGFEIALTYVHKKRDNKYEKICPRL